MTTPVVQRTTVPLQLSAKQLRETRCPDVTCHHPAGEHKTIGDAVEQAAWEHWGSALTTALSTMRRRDWARSTMAWHIWRATRSNLPDTKASAIASHLWGLT